MGRGSYSGMGMIDIRCRLDLSIFPKSKMDRPVFLKSALEAWRAAPPRIEIHVNIYLHDWALTSRKSGHCFCWFIY